MKKPKTSKGSNPFARSNEPTTVMRRNGRIYWVYPSGVAIHWVIEKAKNHPTRLKNRRKSVTP